MTAFYESPWFIAGAALVALLIISLLSRIATGVRNPVARETLDQTDALLRASNKWALEAAQDQNPVVALMHACYAKAFITAVRRVLNDEQLRQAHQVDMCALEEKMDKVERDALQRISKTAPKLIPDGEFAIRTGWVG
jgi:hypothetical protein